MDREHVWVVGSMKPQGNWQNVGSRINCVGAFMQLKEQSRETDGNGSGSFLVTGFGSSCVGTAGPAKNIT